MLVPFRREAKRLSASDELAGLLASCRSELDAVREDIAWNGGRDRAAEDLEGRLSRTVQRLEGAIGTIVRIDRLTSPPSASEAGAPILVREAEHRMKNGLTTVVSLLQRQAANSGDGAVGEALRVASARVAVVTQLHALLGDVTLVRDDDREISLDTYLAAVGRAVAQAMQAQADGRVLEVRVAPASVTPNTAQCLGMVVTELATNALRHAFPPGRPGRVRVTGERVDGCYRLTVADDGKGLPEEALRGPRPRGPGLRLVQTLATELGARLAWDRSGGTRVTLELSEPFAS